MQTNDLKTGHVISQSFHTLYHDLLLLPIFALMPPKRGAAAEFYNHDIRPAKSRQIAVNASSTNNNRRNLNVFSRFYPTVPAEEPPAPDADSYDPTPVDAYQAMLDAQTTEESAAYSEKQSTGIPGITVVAKTRKRYENSVSLYVCSQHALFIERLPTGCSPQDLDHISLRISRRDHEPGRSWSVWFTLPTMPHTESYLPV